MKSYRDSLLLGICQNLQLPRTKYELAEERYHTIGQIIQRDYAFYNTDLHVYPHGSFRQKTTVKPLQEEEYDLDFVVELPTGSSMMPGELYNNIYRILSTDGIHNKMVEKKTRCIRVNYANDFHMDIMPGKLIDVATKEIIVPDRELKNWYHHSNPIGFADWFERQARTNIITEFQQRIVKADAEPITEQEIAERLEPLRRAVQLIKRYRDLYCDINNASPVRSIVISTLMGQISSSYSTEMEIIKDFCNYVNGRIRATGGRPFEVRNPVVNEEVLSEKWNEDIQNYYDFTNMMKSLTDDIYELNSLVVNSDIVAQLKKMFGESVTNDVVKSHAGSINRARLEGTLAVNGSGIINTKGEGIPVKRNTFYG